MAASSRRLLLIALAATALACAPGSGEAAPQPPPTTDGADVAPPEARPPSPKSPAPLRLELEGVFVRDAHELPAGGLVALLERPLSLRAMSIDPDRELAWLARDGSIRARVRAPAGHAVLDAAVHASGETTVLLASAYGFTLARHDADGVAFASTPVVDDAIATDPPALRPGEPSSPIEQVTHDVGRIAADGEGVVLATRTGRHSVIAYRAGFEPNEKRFVVRSRTLVVPAHAIYPVGLTGGTYDVFGQLEAHYAVHVARAESGLAYLAVEHARLETGAMLRAHRQVFGEELVTDPDGLDVFVTRIEADGTRLGTSVVSTPDDDQLYGLRAIGDDAFALGRTEHWNEAGTGFDALVGRVDPGGSVTVRTVAVDRGDVAFDVARAPDGGIVVVGASGYAQNPHGASITEESQAFARWLRADGAEIELPLPRAPRHNEARVVLRLGDGGLVVGGMQDGPGTHSADGDASALRARGFATEMSAAWGGVQSYFR